jgi:hypothetical protein
MCFTMASNYTAAPLPAEVLAAEDGNVRSSVASQTLEELMA